MAYGTSLPGGIRVIRASTSTRVARASFVWAVAIAIAGSLSLRASAQPADAIKRAPAFAASALTTPPTTAWITNGGTLYNQRYSPLRSINRDNVAQLKPKWRTSLNGSGAASKYSAQGQPLLYDGVIYVVTGADDVFAVDAETGKFRWTYQAGLDEAIDVVCCGWESRGLGLGQGKVFVGQLDGKLVALDQRTGAVVWSTQAERWQDGFSITAAPLYYDGLVIVGFAGGDRATRGRIKAFDAKNGKLKWTFYTIPGPGEFGHDTWPSDNDAWKYGGAAIWQTPAIDPELGLVYFSTGNPGPDLSGGVRAGDNLFSTSIVALEVATGKYRWHFQQVHHDLWDYDSPNPVVLFDAPIRGEMRKGIAEVSKTGFTYILDRTNGKPLIGIEERAVPQEPRQATSPTQPYPIGDAVVPQEVDIVPEGFELVNGGKIFTPFWDKPILVKPQATGGANWPPSSYDPESHLLYVCAHDGMGAYSGDLQVDFMDPMPGKRYLNGTYTRSGIRVRGVFAAIDLTTNKLAWRQQWDQMCYSGTLVTAGGLVFVGRNDGRFTALDKANGRQLWEFETDAGVHAPATTFEHLGRQYVVVHSGGSFFPGTKHGDGLWLFSLDGQLTTSGGSPASGPAGAPAAPRTEAGD
jgi:quinohemoprotein ethanol dehydrogenase